MKQRWVAGDFAHGMLAASWAPRRWRKFKSMLAKPKMLCGRFDQSKQLVGLKKPLISNGRFCVVADKGVLWRTLQPFPNTLRLTRDEIVQLRGERVAHAARRRSKEPTVRMINSVLVRLAGGRSGPTRKTVRHRWQYRGQPLERDAQSARAGVGQGDRRNRA